MKVDFTPWGLYFARLVVLAFACLAMGASITLQTISFGSIWIALLGAILGAIFYRRDLLARLANGTGERIDVPALLRSRSFWSQFVGTLVAGSLTYVLIIRFTTHPVFTGPGWLLFILLLQLANARLHGLLWWSNPNSARGNA